MNPIFELRPYNVQQAKGFLDRLLGYSLVLGWMCCVPFHDVRMNPARLVTVFLLIPLKKCIYMSELLIISFRVFAPSCG